MNSDFYYAAKDLFRVNVQFVTFFFLHGEPSSKSTEKFLSIQVHIRQYVEISHSPNN